MKRLEKTVYNADQQPRRFDKPAAIESAKIRAQNQPRCRYCFRYLMSDRAQDDIEKNSHPDGRTPICNWNNLGCDKRFRNSNHLFNHIRFERELTPMPSAKRYKINPLWRGPRIAESVLRRSVWGDDFLELSTNTRCSPCGSNYQCPVCNLRFNGSYRLEAHIKRHDAHREILHCPKDCDK